MRTEGRTLLRKWFREQKRSQRDVAESLHITQQAFSAWLTGSARPDADMREALSVVSKGAVPASSWRTPAERERIDAIARSHAA